MYRHLIFLFLCLFISGCVQWTVPKSNDISFKQDVYVCVDDNIKDEHFAEIQRAYNTLNRSLERWKKFSAIRYGNCSYSIQSTNNLNPENPLALAWTKIGGRDIYLVNGRYEKNIYEITIHEMAHCLGAQHINNTLMHPSYNKHLMQCVDVTTVAQIAAYNRVSIDLLAWCY